MRWPWHRLRAAIVPAFLAFGVLSGCASLPPPPPQTPTHAWAEPQSTALGRIVARAAPPGAGSGFRALISGDDALDARIALADRSERTLDLQYYAIGHDASARRVLQSVAAAAQRGVRVRILLDDLHSVDADATLEAMLRHPHIELRLYNPFPQGRASLITRVLASLGDVSRINRRMHNKLFVADNALAITGGRNLGDPYFDRSQQSNFVDVDLLVAGHAVRALSNSFDAFWNNPLAYPARMFIASTPARAGAAGTEAASVAAGPSDAPLQTHSGQDPGPRCSTPQALRCGLSRDLAAGQLPLVWAPSRVLADRPSKLAHADEPAADETLQDDMEALLHSAQHEVILISPYLVPGSRGMAVLRGLRERGIRVRVLTNSLASTDAPVVHIGYARYREALVRLGVVLNELRPAPGSTPVRWRTFGTSSSKLHVKALVIDRRVALIGSMNFDRRSDRLNTEVGVLVHSPEIAGQLTELYESIAEHGSYRLSLDTAGRLHWSSKSSPATDTQSEPDSSPWLRLTLRLFSPLAPDELL